MASNLETNVTELGLSQAYTQALWRRHRRLRNALIALPNELTAIEDFGTEGYVELRACVIAFGASLPQWWAADYQLVLEQHAGVLALADRIHLKNLGVSGSTYGKLIRIYIENAGQIMRRSEAALRAIRYCGEQTYNELRDKLIEAGLLSPTAPKGSTSNTPSKFDAKPLVMYAPTQDTSPEQV